MPLISPISTGLGVSAERVVLLGQSIGGSVALELAARGHGVALILLCPFLSLSAMVDVAFPIVTPVSANCGLPIPVRATDV
jgi:pimeloyl-ACP methyl ester carboxylesterase